MKQLSFSRPVYLLFTVSLVAMVVLPAHAQEIGFTETFDDPSLPGWEHSPDATVANGVLRIEPDGFAFHPGQWTDLTLEVEARFIGQTTLELAYSASEQGEYTMVIEPDQISLRRGDSELARSEVEVIPPNEWVRLSLAVQAGLQEVKWNDQAVITATDPDPLPPGGIILRVKGSASGEFDNLALVPAGQAPAAPTAAATQAAPPAQAVPAYQAGSWVRVGGPPGGLGYDIRMDPENPDVMYVTDAFSGIHKSTDGGRTWFDISDDIVQFHARAQVFSATVDPHDHLSIWAGTQFSGHIYLSTDGGETWEVRDDGIEKELRSVRGITVDPSNPNVVYAGVEVQPADAEGPAQSVTTGEVYRSLDRGLTWGLIWEGENLARYVWIDPRDTNRIYVSTGIFDRDARNSDVVTGDPGGVGIVRSTDGGRTWEALDEDNGLRSLYVPSLFMHPQNPDILIAAAIDKRTSDATGRPFTLADPSNDGVYVTRDGGDTWEQVLQASVQAVEIATSNVDVWYAGGEGIIYRSDDAGRSWVSYQLASGYFRAGLPIDLQADPRNPYRIFDNNYGGGNFLSEDGGETWVDASRGYTGAEIRGLGLLPGDGWVVVAGAQPGGFVSTDGGASWIALPVPAVVSLALRPVEGAYEFLAGDLDGNLWRGQDGGTTWVATQLVDAERVCETGQIQCPLPMRGLAVAPSNSDTVYAGFSNALCPRGIWVVCNQATLGLYRSRDGGYTWEEAMSVPWEGSLLSLAVHPSQEETVYAATGVGLYRTNDGGNTWRHLESLTRAMQVIPLGGSAASVASPIVMDVELDPFDSQTVYAATILAGVFKSEDGGETWVQVAAGMDPNEQVMDLVADPNRSGVLYAASMLSGVFYTTDGGETWQLLSKDVIRQKRAIRLALNEDGTVLYAGSYFDGVYRLGTPAGSPPAAQAPHATPPPATAAPTATRLPAQPTAPPEAAPTATPKPSGSAPICGGAAALPLALLGIVWLQRGRR